MKRIILSIFILFIGTISSFSQDYFQNKQYPDYSASSHFAPKCDLSDSQIDNIEKFGRVWGYVKYHHPCFGQDDINVDYDFFDLLPEIYNASVGKRTDVLYQWVRSLGAYEEQPYEVSQYVNKNDLSWIDPNILGKQLCDELYKIQWAQRDSNRYVQQTEVHVLFNEDSYGELDDDNIDIGYRLLGVVRYWNIIEYYFPNRDITDKDWNSVLPVFIRKAFDKNIDNNRLFANLISQLNDTHAYSPNTLILGSQMAPIVAKFAEDRMFVTDTCSWKNTRFERGDEIISINGTRPIDRLSEINTYTSHSNRAALLRDASYMAFLTKDSLMSITYRHNGTIYTVKEPTVSIRDFVGRIYMNLYPNSDRALETLSDEIAYINIGGMKSSMSEDVYSDIENIPNLIIDMRTYPAEYDVKNSFFGRYFVKAPELFVRTLKPIANLPGFFRKDGSLNGEANECAYQGNIIILVNAQTQSMGEYFAMLLQSFPNTVTIGSCTAGADGNISEVSLPYDITTCISGIGTYYPDGTNAQRKGIKVDIEILPSADGMRAGKDEVLEKAIEFVLNGRN